MKVKLVILMVFALAFLTACSNIPPELYCESNSDCTAASCCHPTSAMNKESAPDCSGILCTAVCQPETLDCGQGEIRCVENRCTAVIGQ